MNQKIEITKYVASQVGLATDDRSIRKLVALWWVNPRKKQKGGLKLTDEGFARMTQVFTPHRVRSETQIEEYTNQLILRLDNFITCPWYLKKRDMYVFDDKMAIQLVLFSGNVVQFTAVKAKSLESS